MPTLFEDTAEASAAAGISPRTTSTPSGATGESRETDPRGPRSRETEESSVVDHSAWCGPTGEEALAVTTPSRRLRTPVTTSRTVVRTVLRKVTVRASQNRVRAP